MSQEKYSNDWDEINLENTIKAAKVLWSYRLAVIAITIGTLTAGIVALSFTKPQWEGNALFRVSQVAQPFFQQPKIAETTISVITRVNHPSFLQNVLKQIPEANNLSPAEFKLIQNTLSITQDAESSPLRIQVRSYSKELSTKIIQETMKLLKFDHEKLSAVNLQVLTSRISTVSTMIEKEKALVALLEKRTKNMSPSDTSLTVILIQSKLDGITDHQNQIAELNRVLSSVNTYPTQIVSDIAITLAPSMYTKKKIYYVLLTFMGLVFGVIYALVVDTYKKLKARRQAAS